MRNKLLIRLFWILILLLDPTAVAQEVSSGHPKCHTENSLLLNGTNSALVGYNFTEFLYDAGRGFTAEFKGSFNDKKNPGDTTYLFEVKRRFNITCMYINGADHDTMKWFLDGPTNNIIYWWGIENMTDIHFFISYKYDQDSLYLLFGDQTYSTSFDNKVNMTATEGVVIGAKLSNLKNNFNGHLYKFNIWAKGYDFTQLRNIRDGIISPAMVANFEMDQIRDNVAPLDSIYNKIIHGSPSVYKDQLELHNIDVSDTINVWTRITSYENTDAKAYTCQADQYIWHDGDTAKNVQGPLTHTSTLKSRMFITGGNQCDSIIHQSLDIVPSYNVIDTQYVCPGSSYTFNDGHIESNITDTVTYISTYQTTVKQGLICDSLFTTTVINYPVYSENIVDSICYGGNYTLPGGGILNNLTKDSLDTVSLATIHGCDSIFYISIKVFPTYDLKDTVYVCNGDDYTFRDGSTVNNITSEMTHVSHFTTQLDFACDSNWTTLVKINPTYNFTDQDTVCKGDSYTFPNGNVISHVTNTINHVSNLQSINGCDSIITTTIIVAPSYEFFDTVFVCNGSNYTFRDGYTVNDIHNGFDHVSILTTHTFADHPCDSVYNTTIKMYPDLQHFVKDTICYGATYTEPDGSVTPAKYASFLDTLHYNAANGCDSSYYLDIYVHPKAFKLDTVYICSGSDYTSPLGHSFTNVTSNKLDSLVLVGQAQTGCDSTLLLEIIPYTFDLGVSFSNNTIVSNDQVESYSLIDCATNIPMVTNALQNPIHFAKNGSYYLIMQLGECKDTTACFEITGVGIDDLAWSDIKIYPNPTSDLVHLSNENLYAKKINIYDLNGKLLQQNDIKNEKLFQLDVSRWTKGTYLIEIYSKNDDVKTIHFEIK